MMMFGGRKKNRMQKRWLSSTLGNETSTRKKWEKKTVVESTIKRQENSLRPSLSLTLARFLLDALHRQQHQYHELCFPNAVVKWERERRRKREKRILGQWVLYVCLALSILSLLSMISLCRKRQSGKEPANTMVRRAIEWRMLEASVIDLSKLERWIIIVMMYKNHIQNTWELQ